MLPCMLHARPSTAARVAQGRKARQRHRLPSQPQVKPHPTQAASPPPSKSIGTSWCRQSPCSSYRMRRGQRVSRRLLRMRAGTAVDGRGAEGRGAVEGRAVEGRKGTRRPRTPLEGRLTLKGRLGRAILSEARPEARAACQPEATVPIHSPSPSPPQPHLTAPPTA